MGFEQVIPWLVWVIPMVGALLTPAFAALGVRVRDYLAVLFSFASALFAALLLPLALNGEVVRHQVDWIPPLGIRAGVLADPLSILMANVVGWISFLIMLYSIGYMKGEPNLTRYWFFMNFFIGSMQLIVLSDNLLQLFFGWEGVGLCSYALIGFWHTDEEKYWVGTPGRVAWGVPQAYSPSHAGMKAFVTTRIGDISFLIGLLILYAAAGTFEYAKLAEDTGWAADLARVGLLVPVAVLLFGGAVGKSAQFPLHEWLPDAMAGPTAVSALIHAATMVKAGVFLVARLAPIFFVAAVLQAIPFFETIAWIGAFTALLAATQAMVAKEVKKVLAYSTVSQIGYMMLALGVAGLTANFVSGFVAGFFHLMNHAIFKASLFMAAGALIHATESKYIHEMGGLRRNMRVTFYSVLLAGAGLAGIPFFSGFWSKDAILAATLGAEGYPLANGLFLLATATAVITAFYVFRMIGMIFFGGRSKHLVELEETGHHIHEAPRVMWIPYFILAAATLVIGLGGLFFEGLLHHTLGEYLAHTYHIEAVEAAAPFNVGALAASLIAVALGGYIGYHYYVWRRGDPAAVIASQGYMQALYRFFENRWYMNALFYRVFVDPTVVAARGLFRGLEVGVIDRFSQGVAGASVFFAGIGNLFDVYVVDGFVNRVASSGVFSSLRMRRIQTGVAQQYVFTFVIGILAVIFVLVLVVMG